jgi:hypothetical protein
VAAAGVAVGAAGIVLELALGRVAVDLLGELI